MKNFNMVWYYGDLMCGLISYRWTSEMRNEKCSFHFSPRILTSHGVFLFVKSVFFFFFCPSLIQCVLRSNNLYFMMKLPSLNFVSLILIHVF